MARMLVARDADAPVLTSVAFSLEGDELY